MTFDMAISLKTSLKGEQFQISALAFIYQFLLCISSSNTTLINFENSRLGVLSTVGEISRGTLMLL